MTASTSSPSASSAVKIPSSSKSSMSKATKQKRNERERKRVDQVNQGFQLLQERVPKVAGNKSKMSKVETLREATRYIQQLQKQLGLVPVDFPTPEQSPVYPQAMCAMAPHSQTPSPNYTSPYYPPAQMNQYNNSTSSSSSSSST